MYQDNNNIYHWKYTPNFNKEDPYCAILDELNIISAADFNKLDKKQQDECVNTIIASIRKLNIFPLYYYTDYGILSEISELCNISDQFDGKKLKSFKYNGNTLLDFLFPNLHLVEAGNANNNSLYIRFYNDAALSKCIHRQLTQGKFNNLRSVFFRYGRYFWNTATNFNPIRAKAIYEKFCPPSGIILDYSAGFGGRMLGALTSKNNYTYHGIEPNTNTVYNLNKLGNYISQVKPNTNYNIYCCGSENFYDSTINADFIFSCPPFYKLERYSDESSQSVNKFPDYNDWLEGYFRPTITNMYKMLKDDGVFGIDIIDFSYNNKKYSFVNDCIGIILECQFNYIDKYEILSHSRKTGADSNREHVYIFKKDNSPIISYSVDKIEIIPRKPKKYAIYNKYGQLINTSNILIQLAQTYNLDYNILKKNINKPKNLNGYYIKSYEDGAEPEPTTKTKFVCTIDNIDFFSQTDAAKYLGVSRQAVNQAKARSQKIINSKEIIWKNDNE